jgi:hypothetical protein
MLELSWRLPLAWIALKGDMPITFPITLNDCTDLAMAIENILEQFPVRALPPHIEFTQSGRN